MVRSKDLYMKNKSIQNKHPIVPNKRNELLSVLIFALGLGLVIGIISLIYLQQSKKTVILEKSPSPASSKTGVSNNIPNNKDSGSQASTYCKACQASISEKSLVRPKGSDLIIPNHADIKGRWVSDVNGGMVDVTVTGRYFQIFYAPSPDLWVIKYSKGYYVYDDSSGIITLMPALELKPPHVKGVLYKVITARNYDVILRKDNKGQLFWFPPPEALKSRVMHPIFLYTGIQKRPFVRWKRVEKKSTPAYPSSRPAPKATPKTVEE